MEGCLGEESFQMWELNRRLENYLSRVKALEEHNELLSAELRGLRAQSADASWRARADDELAALRALVDQRWREKHAAEMARDNLAEELEGVAGRCQQQRLARERATEEAARSRRAVEAEKCSRIWLSTQATDLERELEALRAAHEEERASLNAEAACLPRGPAPPRGPPAPAPEVEELAQRLGEAWRGAVRGYQERVAHMETSLGQARERLGRAVQGAREGRLELQQLQAERGGLQERRAALEQRLEGRWKERLQATEKFQLAVEALEQEKQGLQNQIAQVLEGRQQLAHLKMSLSLEVATYRTLLEAENTRLQTPGGISKVSLSFQDPKPELHFPGTPEGRRLEPLLPILSPTPLTSPLPDALRIAMPAFLKSQEFLQAGTPTLASTPIPPTPQTPCPATEIRAQEAPLSLVQSQSGKQQAPESLQAEAKVAISASILPGPEEPGGKQQDARPGQSPEDHVSLAPPLNPDHPSLEAKDGEPSGSGVSSLPQEEGEGQIWGLTEEKATIEVKVGSSLPQETWPEEGDLDREEIQEPHRLLEKETLKSLEEEVQEPLMSESHETHRSVEKENQDSLRSLEEENLETQITLETKNQELLKSLEEKDLEVVRSLEKETLELLTPIEKEDPQRLPSLEKEDQELLRSLDDNLETFLFPGKENQELKRSLEEENLESLKALEKENQEPLRSQEAENQETLRPLEKENQEPLRSLEVDDQEILRPLEKENKESLKPLGDENQEILENMDQEPLGSQEEERQETLRSLEKETQEPLRSLGEEDQKASKPLEKENQEELVRSLKEENVKTVKSLETENLESLKSAEEVLGILKPPEIQEPLWSLEEKNQETMKPLEKDIQEPLPSVEEIQETLRPLEKESQGPLRSLGEWNLENLESSKEVDKESQRYQEEEGNLEKGENKDSLRSLEDEGQELPLSVKQQSWEDVVEGDQELSRDPPPERTEVENEDEAELGLREQDGCDGKEEAVEQVELQLDAAGEAGNTAEGHPGSPEPEEQKVPVEGAKGEGGTEDLQDPEGQLDQGRTPGLGAPQGMPEVIKPMLGDEEMAPEDAPVSTQVPLGSETAMGESAVGAEEGLEQEAVRLEDPGNLAKEEVIELPLEEEGLEAKKVQGLEEPRRDLKETDSLESELIKLPRESRDPRKPEESEGWEEPESEAAWGTEEGFPAETLCLDGTNALQPKPEEAVEDAKPVPEAPSSGPTEPCVPTSLPEDTPGAQPQTEGNQEANLGLENRAEAPGKLQGEQELGSGAISEGLQEESGEESEADELGETLPDSTPLVLFPGSPASSKWGPAREERPSPQEEARQESWEPTILASEDLGAHLSEEEEGEEEEGHSHGSDLSEEFEDLGTEASLFPGVPGEVAEPLRQVPELLLEPAAWDRDEESDGFADEEESGEEGEEEEEERKGPGAGRWGPGSSVGSLQTPSGPQRGDLVESETGGASVPWDDGLRGSAADAPMIAQETESQDSAEPSSSEEASDLVSLEKEDKVSGPLETPSGVEDTGHKGTEETLGVNGQGPSWEEESEHMNGGLVNRLEQSEEGGPGKPADPEGNQGSPLEVEEGNALKAPWAGVPLHLGQGQFLKFTQREGDGDSWSSGED
ncbi:nestin [Orycteropus afer afer]|uniref:Nestin n=1 Tax=Orycteropus afer afer TaxID=1230840 RepID=A0A8B7AGL2_ORYAF|nr:nestin [Orycteropus afer afer]